MMKIGEINNEGTLGDRDAYHMPAVTATTHEALEPGQKVVFVNSQTVEKYPGVNYDGIVDPFLSKRIQPFDRFLVFVNPKIVGPVKHSFSVHGYYGEFSQNTEEDDDSCSWC